MKVHNDIGCAHCGSPFDFSEHPSVLVHGNEFKGVCANCREVHIFTVNIVDDVLDGNGQMTRSIMIDRIPLRPKEVPERPKPPKDLLGEAILAKARGKRLAGISDDTGPTNYSQETLEDLNDTFDPGWRDRKDEE